ncbi:MAG: carbamoyl phosphate synthase large subunit [Zetaproteobacteria bacterium CG12_big_fil_rev_8_21_14_0_65_55_1124]|nr:MAG: carbamoyl phosphate synthase large subunit [Zetaproteobacteria bacterium CG1_02_55_237]PIS18546.1 MAG: carbamoyl phosphate synthase large subunit [Zetaproteobacteria bacterium CG08_land_8_20_14_0_20_55_17]PIW42023.1 MAG: carbamoyl phosphate synthase large subunit [Zetaproteobacteria bacterium CG12_big_fil_rev_8_21_14_0_65_55_1124]PIY53928.1 MAG: carbamoyl phosphate synthase large subunit [Zetaproteobacteria bacterium CG_4_10_14_0_8_um_filter_55_43]PIZ39373.1 MAG: carbamoyl phosphate syn
MPRRNDIKSILILGAGPIVIGQACEFDYSGVQACKALREDGFRVILVNSNPATIMTDPEFADATYIEPVTWEVVAKIIEKERPDAILPTMGGQTALNCALSLNKHGILEKFNVKLIGAQPDAIDMAEDRERFKEAMDRIGLEMARGGFAHNMNDARALASEIGYPIIIRPSFTLGGSGGGIAYNPAELEEIAASGLEASPTDEILVEESIIGWKEYEMEVMRDKNDNCVIICSIENLDAMGVHTGDSITVAPAQTLTDKEYQRMRDASIAILREIGVETGGSNVQFAVSPETGRLIVIEMNPRVSRSSALASKATGFPIAKIAAKLAVGYTLDEIRNDITGETWAAFEPSIDYVVTKMPRFAFEKFPGADCRLTTQMKSVGEVMAIGRCFAESLGKAMRGLETGTNGFDLVLPESEDLDDLIQEKLTVPGADRLWWAGEALRLGEANGWDEQRVIDLTRFDPWFVREILAVIEIEQSLAGRAAGSLSREDWREAKRSGLADARLAQLLNCSEAEVKAARVAQGVVPVFKRVDTCAAEFEAKTPYLYSTYEDECEANPSKNKKIMVLGGGPNRIGQGIEFDYCCVHASFALSEDGIETIMVNCNPETVSTDYDTSDRLYFEPLTFEDVMAIVETEKPDGVIVQFGGQTPLKLAEPLEKAGVPIIGTSPDMIDLAEDRERFQQLLHKLGLKQPENGTARSVEQAVAVAKDIGFPVVVRPSYVLGGRAMQIVHDEAGLLRYMREAVNVSHDHPVLLDRFLNQAIELDVDALCDNTRVVVGGIMEHIEEAGVHSGDSACCLPPHSISKEVIAEVTRQTEALGLALHVKGLMNIQFALQGNDLYVLEVNPRASRTVPFVSKATGVPLAKLAARIMAGATLDDLGIHEITQPTRYRSVKEAVFPFVKFRGVDPLLSPEMKSTGEVMGIATDFAAAFAKAQLGAGCRLPTSGRVFVSVREADRPAAIQLSQLLVESGFDILATAGTHRALNAAGVKSSSVAKVTDGARPHIVDRLLSGDVALVVNTTEGAKAIADSKSIRQAALVHAIPYFTTIAGGLAAAQAILRHADMTEVKSIQDYHGG